MHTHVNIYVYSNKITEDIIVKHLSRYLFEVRSLKLRRTKCKLAKQAVEWLSVGIKSHFELFVDVWFSIILSSKSVFGVMMIHKQWFPQKVSFRYALRSVFLQK